MQPAGSILRSNGIRHAFAWVGGSAFGFSFCNKNPPLWVFYTSFLLLTGVGSGVQVSAASHGIQRYLLHGGHGIHSSSDYVVPSARYPP